jgi:3-hydroxybutyryl-CoA dehydrogenase
VGCFGHPMGPLATADLIGLDTILLSLESLRTRLHDEKYEPASLLRRLVAEKRLGRKAGRGFFSYRNE